MTTIIGPVNDASPGPVIVAALEPVMISDGWLLVDTVIIGGNTHKVYKSPAAGNVRNLDWYLDINYPTTGTSGGMRFTPFEDYNATTHLAFRGPISGANTTTVEQTYYSQTGATGSALETTWANTASHGQMSLPLSASAFTYYISVTRNRIIGMLTNATGFLHYAGFFTPTAIYATNAGSALFPLIMCRIKYLGDSFTGTSGAGNFTLAFTRFPKYPNGGINWGLSGYTTSIMHLIGGRAGVATHPTTNQTTLVPIAVMQGGQTSNSGAGFVGTLDDVAGAWILSTAVRGDSITIGSDTWYTMTPTGDQTVFFKAV